MHLYWNSGFARSIRVLNNETHDVYIVGKMWKKVEKERIRSTNCSFTLINFLCGSLYEDFVGSTSFFFFAQPNSKFNSIYAIDKMIFVRSSCSNNFLQI